MYRINLTKADLLNPTKPAIATIGNFDGLHLGHIEIFAELNRVAKSKNYRKLAITFEPLPAEYFKKTKSEQLLARLSLLRDKFLILKKQQLIDELIIFNFNSTIANLTPQDFIQDILLKRLNIVHMVIGHDFKFGKEGEGSAIELSNSGISLNVVEPYIIDNQRLSSSLIRDLAKNNQLALIKKYLGRNLQYTSRVIYGNQLGRKLGVPTINLSIGWKYPALWGIYIALVTIDGKTYNSVASIGKNPTVSNSDIYKLEAHLLDVDLNLYGKIATVEILEFIREERKFIDLSSLITQMQQDLFTARNYFKANLNGL